MNSDNNNGKDEIDNISPILTLYIAPIEPNMISQIEEYFKQFGEVTAACSHSGNDFSCGFVQFKEEECAKAALTMTSHRVGDCFVKIKAAHHWHQHANQWPEDPLLASPDQNSPQQIMNKLNDDCLRAMFQFFKLIDLCNAAEVCIRFNQIAKEVFRSKYRFSTIRMSSLNNYEVKSLLKNFGSLITIVEVDFNHVENVCGQHSFLAKIEAKCGNLKKLELKNFSDLGLECHPLFSKLSLLSLKHCHFGVKAKDVLSGCKKLETLGILSCSTASGAFINQNFPMLKWANFDFSTDVFVDGWHGFLTSNPTLRYLSICGNALNSKLFAWIGQSIPNLMYLHILGDLKVEQSSFQRDIVFLSQLKSLRTLTIELCSLSMTPLITSLVTNQIPIQDLTLSNGVIDDNAVEGLSQLKQIESLDLTCIEDLTDEDVVNLSKELPELNKLVLRIVQDDFGSIALKKVVANAKKLSSLRLELCSGIEIDIDDYKAMLESVKSRPEKVKLMIKVREEDNIDVPEDMMNANREWLYIDTY